MVTAMKKAIPDSLHISCVRYLEENFRRHLSTNDEVPYKNKESMVRKIFGRKGIVASATDIVDLEISLEKFSLKHPEVSHYFMKKLSPQLLENMVSIQQKPNLKLDCFMD